MPYVYVEEDHGGGALGVLIGIAILLALARWELEAFVILLPGILAFLATTFVMCTGIIRLARRVCTDGRLDDLRDAGFNPFGSIARAADAILSALPPGPGRLVAPPGAATSEAVLAAGMGGLLAFGLSCWATGALSTWQRTGRWDPTAPLPMALVGAAVAVYGARLARRWLDRAYPKRVQGVRVELLEHGPLAALDPAFGRTDETLDEMG